jgi:hypothetical protein
LAWLITPNRICRSVYAVFSYFFDKRSHLVGVKKYQDYQKQAEHPSADHPNGMEDELEEDSIQNEGESDG